jgi:P-type E1-E2 ATPase
MRAYAAALQPPAGPVYLSIPLSDWVGRGALALVNGEQAVVGNRMLFKELGILTLEGSVSDDVTEIFVARGGRYLGSNLISDQLRPSSAAAVRSLRAMNIEVVLLTGDTKQTALAFASHLGIHDVHAELLPE